VFSERDLRSSLHSHFETPNQYQIREHIVTAHTDQLRCQRKRKNINGSPEKWAPVVYSFEYHHKIPSTLMGEGLRGGSDYFGDEFLT